MYSSIPLLMSAAIVSIILFQSIIIAPAINKLINKKEASIFLRFLWPKFFLIIALLSILSFFIIINSNINQIINKYIFILSSILMVFCYFITPLINKMKDIGNNKWWNILHLLTVFLTVITLLLNILVIIIW